MAHTHTHLRGSISQIATTTIADLWKPVRQFTVTTGARCTCYRWSSTSRIRIRGTRPHRSAARRSAEAETSSCFSRCAIEAPTRCRCHRSPQPALVISVTADVSKINRDWLRRKTQNGQMKTQITNHRSISRFEMHLYGASDKIRTEALDNKIT